MRILTIGVWLLLAVLVGLFILAPAFGLTRGQALVMDVKALPAWIVLFVVRAAYLSRLSATTGEKR